LDKPSAPQPQILYHYLLSYGLCIKDGKIYCGNIELSFSKIARAIGVDRRVVMNTVETIEKNKELKNF